MEMDSPVVLASFPKSCAATFHEHHDAKVHGAFHDLKQRPFAHFDGAFLLSVEGILALMSALLKRISVCQSSSVLLAHWLE